MLVVGLTGGIASGKSTASERFAELGAHIIDADAINRSLLNTPGPALTAIINHFGEDIALPDGNINSRQLRRIIFQSQSDKQWLESLLHPLIRQTIASEIEQPTPCYHMVVIPLLYHRHDYPYLNQICTIETSLAEQRQRLTQRDSLSSHLANAMISAQPSPEQRQALANDIITNTGTVTELLNKVDQLHQRYLNLATAQPSA